MLPFLRVHGELVRKTIADKATAARDRLIVVLPPRRLFMSGEILAEEQLVDFPSINPFQAAALGESHVAMPGLGFRFVGLG